MTKNHRRYLARMLGVPAAITLLVAGLPAVAMAAEEGSPVVAASTGNEAPDQDVVVNHSVHDVSAPLRDFSHPPTAAPAASAAMNGKTTAPAHRASAESLSGSAPAPSSSQSVEQTTFGPRPPLPTVANFDNGLNGGSTSDNNIAAGPDSIVVMRNSQFKVMTKTGATVFGPVNNNSVFAGTNTIEQVALDGDTTSGDSYRLRYNEAQSVPIVHGQNDTAAGIQAAIQGGNEQQQVSLTGYTGTDSYTLTYDGVHSVPFVRDTNNTATAITTALNGVSEEQTISLTGDDKNGDSYALRYHGHKSTPIVRGQNDTPAGIQNALQGGNEVQTIAFSNFDSANSGNTFRVKIGDRLSGTLGFATQLGDATPITSQNLSDQINAIFGFPGMVTVTGASNTGFTVTFGGASARKDVPPIQIVFGDCASAPTPCTSTNRETAKGGTAMPGWPAGGTVTAGPVTDGGYSLTFGGAGFQGSDADELSVGNGTGGTTGTVTQTVKGTRGLLPVGAVATVDAVTDTGYTVTFGGALANTTVDRLTVTNGTGDTAGTVRETVRGSQGFAGWTPGTTVSVGAVSDTGYTVTFNALSTLGSATHTGLGDVNLMSVTDAGGGVSGTVTKTQHGTAGIGQGRCTNSGDGHIRYDQLAGRWLFTTPAFTRVGGLYAMCYAVSATSDPTGQYNRYVFTRSLFPDYPRVTVWPDGYYNATSTGDTVIEKHACAADRARMLQGLDASEQCIIVPGVSFMEPSDLEGQAVPPRGEPEHFFAAGGSQLRGVFEDDGIYTYKFHVDWKKPLNSAFTGPTKIAVAPYHFLCNGQLSQCVPQPGSTTRLDSQGDKLMHSVVYRNHDGVQSFVMLHSINTAVGAGGERWYEMRLDAGDDPKLYQQSTYAPDDHYRWLGSPNMDHHGDIAMAYSFGGGPYTPPIATTLATAPNAGDANIKVTAVSGTNVNFAPGAKIDIGTGTTQETATVRTVGTPGATGTGVDLTAPLTLPHTSGSPVSNAAYSCVRPACLPVGQRFTARQPHDPRGTMSYQEGVIINGISAAGGSRWEDWSKLALDPTDDCTFWYFGGYGDASRTGGPYFGRVGAFRLPTCRLDAASQSLTTNLHKQFNGTVATFTDTVQTATAKGFTASIDWGDGTRATGVVSGAKHGFNISGSHTYTAVGRYKVTTSITGTDGSLATATSNVSVH